MTRVPTSIAAVLPHGTAWLATAVITASLLLTLSPERAIASPNRGAPGPGGVGIQLLDAPPAAVADPRARLYIVDHLAPGAVIRRRVQVSNTTAASVRVALYAAAAAITRGTFLGADGRTANGLSSWTTVQPGEVQVPSQGRTTVTVTITIPVDAAPGEQYGVVWAETRSATPAGGGVVQVNRVGVRLYVSVGPGGAPAAAFTIDSLTAGRSSDGRPVVLAAVHNTGGRALDLTGDLALSAGPEGLSAGPFPVDLGVTLGVGATESVTVVLGAQIPAGPWTARLALRSGRLEQAAEATITFPDRGMGAAVRAAPSRPAWHYAVLAAALLLIAALALWAASRWLRRRRRLHPRAPAMRLRPAI